MVKLLCVFVSWICIFGSVHSTNDHITCEEFSNITARSLEYYVFTHVDVMKHSRQELQEGLQQMLGIDISKPDEIKDMSCAVLNAKTVKEIANALGPYINSMGDEDLEWTLKYWIGDMNKVIDYSWTSIVEQSMTKGWMTITGFPNFPLDISYSQALRSVEDLDVDAAERLGMNVRYDRSKENLDNIANALVESQSLEEYTRRVFGYSSHFSNVMRWMNVLDEQIKGVQTYQELMNTCFKAGLLSLPLQ